MTESVRVACSGSMLLPLAALRPFQGNLKELSEENYRKLRKEILELGFSSPFHVWRAGDGELYLLDGHQRLRTLTAMQNEGHEIPELPAVQVEAADVHEAKRKVLALTSQYGEITRDGLWEFMQGAEMKMEEVATSFRFPEIDLGSFILEHGTDPEMPPLEEGDRKSLASMTFTLSPDQAKLVAKAIAQALTQGDFGATGNENKNGNALARVCSEFLGEA